MFWPGAPVQLIAMKRFLLLLPMLWTGAMAAEKPVLPKVTALKTFPVAYPMSSSLAIPFNGCVVLAGELPKGTKEQWLPVDELIKDRDFEDLKVLVDSGGSILGAKATYKGPLMDWKGEPGFQARLRVLRVFSLEDSPETRAMPLKYDGSDFGGMLYTFDEKGGVVWRKKRVEWVETEMAYVTRMEEHNRGCVNCRPGMGLPRVVASVEHPVKPEPGPEKD